VSGNCSSTESIVEAIEGVGELTGDGPAASGLGPVNGTSKPFAVSRDIHTLGIPGSTRPRNPVEKPGLDRKIEQCVEAKGPTTRHYRPDLVSIVKGALGARAPIPSRGWEST